MRFAQPPVPTLRSVFLRMVLLSGSACMLAGSAGAGATYSYDQLGRLVSVRYDDGKQITYTYDAAGNRTQHVVSATTINRPPVAVADSITLNENQSSITFNPRANDTDPDGNALTLYSVAGGEVGTSALSGGNTTVTYSSSLKRTATDLLYYTITDGQGMDASGEITVTLANLPPTVATDTLSMVKNTVKTFDPRANDSDPGGDTFAITAKGTPAHGTVTIGTGGASLIYTPTANYAGPDSFTYTVTDIDGGASTGTVNMTVTHGTTAPIAVADTRGVMGGQTRTFDPRVNDSDDSGTITVTSKTNGAHGTVTINSGTSVSYAAQTGWTGNDTFNYTITDLDGQTATTTVTMDVSATNRAPIAGGGTGVHNAGWTYGSSTPYKPSIPITTADSDPDGHAITITGKTNGTIGTVTLANNALTWTKNTNVMGEGQWTDAFTYTISDGNGGTATGTVNITVTITCTSNCP